MAELDFTQPVNQVRLLISDVDEANLVLEDVHIEGYLGLYGVVAPYDVAELSQVRRAAADALDAIASSEALIGKVIRTQLLTTDGPKTADALRKHASSLRALADAASGDDSTDGYFGVADFRPYATRGEAAEWPVW